MPLSIWISWLQDFMEPESINVFRKAWNKFTEGCNIWLRKSFYLWLPEAYGRKIFLDAPHFLQTSLSTQFRTRSEKDWARSYIFDLLQYCHYEFRIKVSSNILVEEEARGLFSIHVCQWCIAFDFTWIRVKLLVLWVGFLSSENENRPYIFTQITFIGMRGNLAFNK